MKTISKTKILSLTIALSIAPFFFSCGSDENKSNSSEDADTVSQPVFSPKGGDFSNSQTIRITTKTDGAFINYTSDGSKPNCTDNGVRYEGKLNISLSASLNAIACKNWMASSSIINEKYNIGFKIKAKLIKKSDDDTVEDQVMSFAYIQIVDPETREKTFTTADYFGNFTIALSEGDYFLNAYWSTTYNPELVKDNETKGPYDSESFFLNVNSAGQTQANAFSVSFLSENPQYYNIGESLNIPSEAIKVYTAFSYNNSKLATEKLYWDALDDSSGSPTITKNYSYNSDGSLAYVISDAGTEGDYKDYSYNEQGKLSSVFHYSGQGAIYEKLFTQKKYTYDGNNVASVSFEDKTDSSKNYFREYEYNEEGLVNKISVYSGSSSEDKSFWIRTVEYEFYSGYTISSMTIYEPNDTMTHYTYEYSGENFIVKKYRNSDFADSDHLSETRINEISNGDMISRKTECEDTQETDCKSGYILYEYENEGLPTSQKFYSDDDTLLSTMSFVFNDYQLSSLAQDVENPTADDIDFFLKIDIDENKNMIALKSYANQLDDSGTPYVEKKWFWQANDGTTTGDATSTPICGNGTCETGEDTISCSSDCTISMPTAGLVAYYPFIDDYLDKSGYGNDASCTGATCPTLSTDRFSKTGAYNFDGTDDYLEIGAISNILTNPTDNYTVSFWAKITSGGSIISTIDTTMSMDDDYPFSIDSSAGDFFSSASYAGTIKEISTSTASYNDSKWHSIIFIMDKSNLTEYLHIDNIQISSIALDTADYIDSGTLRFAANYQNNMLLNFFSGQIDDIRIYNRVLTTTEISTLYGEGGWTGN